MGIPAGYATTASVTAGTYTLTTYTGVDWAGQAAAANQVLVNTDNGALTNTQIRDLVVHAINGKVLANIKYNVATTPSGIPGISADFGSQDSYADVVSSQKSVNANTITMTASAVTLSPITTAQAFDGGFDADLDTRITGSVVELSRGLIHFDYSSIRNMMTSSIDVNSPTFTCKLKLFDVTAGQTCPKGFTLMVAPLATSFDEGFGNDVISFSSLGSSNFLTASSDSSSASIWVVSGANASGSSGVLYGNTGRNTDIDFFERGFTKGVSNPEENLVSTQYFEDGSEDLSIDITSIVSASLVGIIPNYGLRLSFTSSEEIDDKTRFVKRFGSRHLTNFAKVPRVEVTYNDSIQDNHRDFFFNISGSIFMQNYHRGRPANVLSSSVLDPQINGHGFTTLSGRDCMMVTLRTGSFVTQSIASQHTASSLGVGMAGLYSASFCMPFSSGGLIISGTGWSGETIHDFAQASGSIVFEEYWSSLDGTVGFYTGSLEIKRAFSTSYNSTSRDLDLIVTNCKDEYKKSDEVRIRVFVRDFDEVMKAKRVPYDKKSVVVDKVYYRIVNADTNNVVIPFETSNDATRLSTDMDGLYFDLQINSLDIGSDYTIEFLVVDRGISITTEGKNARFKVVS